MNLRAIFPTPLSSSIRIKPSVHPPRRSLAVSAQLSTTAAAKFSISDETLESCGFLLRHTTDDLNLDQLNAIFVAVGFPKRDPEKIRIALENTETLLWVEYRKTKKPVAFARATGDGVFNAIIWDVVVDPSFQGIGLGKAVMERLIEELLREGDL